MNMVIFWAVLLVLFLAGEFATTGLISIWFAIGAAAAVISAVVAPDLVLLQVIIFLVVSAAALIFTRPLVKKYHKTNRTATNANRVLDMVGIVREPVDSLSIQGTVYVGGKLWSARTEEGAPSIPVGTQVDILQIDGNKLIVRPVTRENIEEVTEAPPEQQS